MAQRAALDQARIGGPFLSQFSVQDLFGRYSYDVDVPPVEAGPNRLILLFGENGSGKTTLLHLVWHLLSPADNRGHRSFLARTPFRRMTVHLADGASITVVKTDGLVGRFDVTVGAPDHDPFTAPYEATPEGAILAPTDWRRRSIEEAYGTIQLAAGDSSLVIHPTYDSVVASEEARNRFIQYLEGLDSNPLLLADDRGLYSDDPELTRLRQQLGRREELEPRNPEQYSKGTIARELSITMRRVNEQLRRTTIGAQTQGSAGANTIYLNVIRQIAGQSSQKVDEAQKRDPGLIDSLLAHLSDRSPRFEEFHLVPKFEGALFAQLLHGLDATRKEVAASVLIPYFESLVARYDALENAEQLIRTLLTLTNDFLVDKQMTFDPREGLNIVTDSGEPLDPEALSSGERQLTMLLCTTLLARRDSRLFLIDEPEMSLGVSWQRRIVDSLLKLTAGTPLQFLIATHSVEIVTSQRSSLIRLGRTSDGPSA